MRLNLFAGMPGSMPTLSHARPLDGLAGRIGWAVSVALCDRHVPVACEVRQRLYFGAAGGAPTAVVPPAAVVCSQAANCFFTASALGELGCSSR